MTDGRKKIGEMLIDKGILTEAQLLNALNQQKRWGGKLGTNLVNLGYINEIILLKFLAEQFKIPCVDLTKIKPEQHVISHISPEIVKKYHILPLQEKEEKGRKFLFVAMSEPGNIQVIEELEFLTNHTIKPVIAAISQIDCAISRYYDGEDWIEIPHLKEKVDTVHPDDIERLHDEDVLERVESARDQGPMEKNAEMMAMFRLLVKKGIFTKGEFEREVKDLKDKNR